MKISEYIKYKGMQKILEECSNDLTDVKHHLMRECGLKKGYDLSKYMVEFKEILETSAKQANGSARMQEFLSKLGVIKNDN